MDQTKKSVSKKQKAKNAKRNNGGGEGDKQPSGHLAEGAQATTPKYDSDSKALIAHVEKATTPYDILLSKPKPAGVVTPCSSESSSSVESTPKAKSGEIASLTTSSGSSDNAFGPPPKLVSDLKLKRKKKSSPMKPTSPQERASVKASNTSESSGSAVGAKAQNTGNKPEASTDAKKGKDKKKGDIGPDGVEGVDYKWVRTDKTMTYLKSRHNKLVVLDSDGYMYVPKAHLEEYRELLEKRNDHITQLLKLEAEIKKFNKQINKLQDISELTRISNEEAKKLESGDGNCIEYVCASNLIQKECGRNYGMPCNCGWEEDEEEPASTSTTAGPKKKGAAGGK